MANVSIIGIDISKRSFQIHGATADGAPVLRRNPASPGGSTSPSWHERSAARNPERRGADAKTDSLPELPSIPHFHAVTGQDPYPSHGVFTIVFSMERSPMRWTSRPSACAPRSTLRWPRITSSPPKLCSTLGRARGRRTGPGTPRCTTRQGTAGGTSPSCVSTAAPKWTHATPNAAPLCASPPPTDTRGRPTLCSNGEPTPNSPTSGATPRSNSRKRRSTARRTVSGRPSSSSRNTRPANNGRRAGPLLRTVPRGQPQRAPGAQEVLPSLKRAPRVGRAPGICAPPLR